MKLSWKQKCQVTDWVDDVIDTPDWLRDWCVDEYLDKDIRDPDTWLSNHVHWVAEHFEEEIEEVKRERLNDIAADKADDRIDQEKDERNGTN